MAYLPPLNDRCPLRTNWSRDVGLIFLFNGLHAVIIRNLVNVFRYPRAPRELYDVAAGSLALYVNLVVSGLFNSTIGGRPTTLFILFLAVFVVSESLRRELTKSRRLAEQATTRARAKPEMMSAFI